MSATIHFLGQARRPPPPTQRNDRPARVDELPGLSDHPRWLVDPSALAHCRAVLLGQNETLQLRSLGRRGVQAASMEVPPAYDRFCRAHFAALKRLNPSLDWDDAYPAYAIALSAHAALCVAFSAAQETQLERHWDRIRGSSRLSWAQGRPLISAGCSALDRLDPLAMVR